MMKINFDQYQRYKLAEMLIKLLTPDSQPKILEVGANEHQNLSSFLPGYPVYFLDIRPPEAEVDLKHFIIADATRMPFVDNYFDYVVALDVYEHIVPGQREQFLSECARVANQGVVIAAPFSTPENNATERRVNSFYKHLCGRDHIWLQEHFANGLPDLDQTMAILARQANPHIAIGHGDTMIWEKLMRIHFTEVAIPKLKNYATDIYEFYNANVCLHDFVAEGYRQFLVIGKQIDQSRLDLLSQDIIPDQPLNDEIRRRLLDLENSFYNLHYHESGDRSLEQTRDIPVYRGQLYIDTGEGFSEDQTITHPISLEYSSLVFDVVEYQSIRMLRCDPVNTKVILRLEEIVLVYENNRRHQFKLSDVKNNSDLQVGNVLFYDNNDPQIIFGNRRLLAGLRKVMIKFEFMQVNDNIYRLYAKSLKEKHAGLNYKLMVEKFPVLLRKFWWEAKRNGIRYAIIRTKNYCTKKNLPGAEYQYQEPINIGYMHRSIHQFAYRPLISIIMPVYNVKPQWLQLAIDSVKNQVYDNWELCIVDDVSINPQTRKFLANLHDSRIRCEMLQAHQGISGCSNRGLAMARGDYIALLDHDDELAIDALYEVVKAINEHDPDFIYSDEDKVNIHAEYIDPHFKPNYSPDMLLSQNYICHLCVYRKAFIDRLGGFRQEYLGAQDYDLVLRTTENTNKIHHICKVLYHWRTIPGSTSGEFYNKSYASEAGKKALEAAIERRQLNARIEYGIIPGTYRIQHAIQGEPLVSIVIPFKDQPKLLDVCVNSILKKSTYRNFEIIGISNSSEQQETFAMMEKFKAADSRIHFFEYNIPFNYSKINNYAVTLTKGEHILLLNNDIEVISPDWIEALLEFSQRQGIGAVGAKLYYPDNTIQHAGVIVGLGGVAGHSHKHLERYGYGYFARPNIIQNLSAVTAACLMIKKTAYQQVGGFNEALKIAFNDVDFCLRLRECGYLNVYTPYCEMYHYESVSRGYEDNKEKQARFFQEISYIKKRHRQTLEQGDPYYNPNLTLYLEDFSLKISGQAI